MFDKVFYSHSPRARNNKFDTFLHFQGIQLRAFRSTTGCPCRHVRFLLNIFCFFFTQKRPTVEPPLFCDRDLIESTCPADLTVWHQQASCGSQTAGQHECILVLCTFWKGCIRQRCLQITLHEVPVFQRTQAHLLCTSCYAQCPYALMHVHIPLKLKICFFKSFLCVLLNNGKQPEWGSSIHIPFAPCSLGIEFIKLIVHF